VHRVDFAAADHRVCRRWQVRIADGVSVSARWRYRTPHGWTSPLPADTAFVVDCPKAPHVAILLTYDCEQATFVAVLGGQQGAELEPLHNATRHRMVLDIEGAVSGRYEVDPGSTATLHSFPLTCGSHETVSVRGGIERSGGEYNYGSAAKVAIP
jgi:hypothetical protein